MPNQADIDLFLRTSIAKAALPVIKEIESALFAHLQSPSCAPTLHGLFASSEALRRTLVINRRPEMLCVMLTAQRAAMQKILAKGNLSYESKKLLKVKWEQEKTEKEKDIEEELKMLLWLWDVMIARVWEREVAFALGLPPLPVLWGHDERLRVAKPKGQNLGVEREEIEIEAEQLKWKGAPEKVGNMTEPEHKGYPNDQTKPTRKSILKPPRKQVKFEEGCQIIFF